MREQERLRRAQREYNFRMSAMVANAAVSGKPNFESCPIKKAPTLTLVKGGCNG